MDTTKAVWVAKSDEESGIAYQVITFTLKLWHDDQNIHWSHNVLEDSRFSANGCSYHATIENITFR